MPRLLLVEDNELSRDMLSRRLARRGYDVLTAVDGEESLAIAERQAPDLILMDLTLPVIDGYETMRRLRANARTQSIPIIVLSAHVLDASRDQASLAGCDDYDVKPIDFPRLIEKIETILARKRPLSKSSSTS
jgi:two-component system, cell cycle response regulator DivK